MTPKIVRADQVSFYVSPTGISLKKTGEDNPPLLSGESYVSGSEKDPGLLPPSTFKKSDFPALPVEQKPPSINTLAKDSAEFTESVAGAMSNSLPAGFALQIIPSSGSDDGAKDGDAEIQKQKGDLWTAKRKEIEGLTDGLGMGLDEKIKDTVIALQVNGFNTRQSCEGHIDWGCGAPWVDVQAPGEPEPLFGHRGNSIFLPNRFNNSEQIFMQVAAKNGITVDEMMDRDKGKKYEHLVQEANELSFKNGERVEFSKWRESNRAIRNALEELLGEYYEVRNVTEDNKIKFMGSGDDSFRIYTGTYEDLFRNWRSMSESEKAALGKRLEDYRKAMNDFTIFLHERFMAKGPALAGK